MNKIKSIAKQYEEANNEGNLLADLQRTFLNEGEYILTIEGHNYIIQKCPELFYLIIEITDLKHKLNNLVKASPQSFIKLYRQNLIASEIVSASNLAGVKCNHADIFDLVMSESTSKKKHSQYVAQYLKLINKELNITSPINLSKVFYDAFTTSIRKNELTKMGVLFREGTLSKDNSLVSEPDIFNAVSTSFEYYNDNDENQLIKAAVIHYFIDYIKPFTASNIQVNHLLTTNLLFPELGLASLKLSSSIETNYDHYCQMISETNDSNNVYDLTAFVYEFLKLTFNNIKDTIYELAQNNKQILQFKTDLKALDLTNNDKRCLLACFEGSVLGLELTTKQIMYASKLSNPTVLKCSQKLADLGYVSISKPGKQKIVRYETHNITS